MRDMVGPGKGLVVLRVSILGLVKGFDLTQGGELEGQGRDLAGPNKDPEKQRIGLDLDLD